MAILTLSRKFNQWLGPFLLRHGLRARHRFGGGGGGGGKDDALHRDNPHLDALLGISLAQWLVSLEIHDETRDAIAAGSASNVSVMDFWLHPKQQQANAANSSKQQDGRHDNDNDPNRTLTLEEETEIRLQVLNKYLRPVLVGKNEQWSDVQQWQFHPRFIKWARREYFRAKYGSVLRATMDAFPALRKSPQLSSNSKSSSKKDENLVQLARSNSNSKNLPSTSLVTMALGMEDWSQTKNTRATYDSMNRVAQRMTGGEGGRVLQFHGGALCIPDIPQTTKLTPSTSSSSSVSSSAEGEAEQDLLTIEDLLEVVGGHVATCGPLNALCEEADIYQLWTREYVQALGRYLLQRAEDFDDDGGGETIVLDVGAGDGLLAECLRDYLEKAATEASTTAPRRPLRSRQQRSRRKQRPSSAMRNNKYTKIPTVLATDNGSWKVFPKADVEMLGYEESLEKYANRITSDEVEEKERSSKQVIVLCSWMPMNDDWSATFRQYGVDEYILIGECDDGQCGDNWQTWGNRHFLPSDRPQSVDGGEDGSDAQPEAQPLAYEVDGYIRTDLNDMQRFQFSRFDSSASKYGKTVSFRRNRYEP